MDLAPAGGLDLVPVQQQQQPGGGQVSLSVLIEMMVQKIYHELTILAELLPRNMTMLEHFSTFPALEAHLTRANNRTNNILVLEEKLNISIFLSMSVFLGSNSARMVSSW